MAPLLPGRSMRSLRARLGAGDQGRSSSGGAVGREREAVAVPGEADGAGLGEAPLVEHLSRLASGRRGQRADDDIRPRAIFLEGHPVFDEGERLALGQRADAAVAVAGRGVVARLGGLAPVAVGRQPLFGGESVETFADDGEAPVGVAQSRLFAARRDDDVVARPARPRR